jgi:glycosyltransferase involved in cell wall biosynthesis
MIQFRLLIVTPIPVYRELGYFHSSELWVRDIEAQAKVVERICIVAPLGSSLPPNLRMIPPHIVVELYDAVQSQAQAEELVRKYDVVQVGSGMPRWRSQVYLRFAQAARKANRCLITAVSSNRVKTTLLNSAGKSWLSKLKARIVARSVLNTLRALAIRSNGILLVGHGLVELLPATRPEVYIETATWISVDDILPQQLIDQRVHEMMGAPRLRACIAARLEHMKGVHVAIEALNLLRDRLGSKAPTLAILGKGPELQRLQEMVKQYGLNDLVTFEGVFGYPQPFLREIGKCHLVLFTNLSDEQPRLIFDAVSQGVLPICPNTAPYRELGIDERTMYDRGDSGALARVIERINTRLDLPELTRKACASAAGFTIDSMHSRRADWVLQLLGRHRANQATTKIT